MAGVCIVLRNLHQHASVPTWRQIRIRVSREVHLLEALPSNARLLLLATVSLLVLIALVRRLASGSWEFAEFVSECDCLVVCLSNLFSDLLCLESLRLVLLLQAFVSRLHLG